MDTRTGEIIDEAEAKKRWEILRKQLGWEEADKTIVRLPSAFAATPKQKKTNKIGRNDPCPCGSGRKFKKCCMRPQHRI